MRAITCVTVAFALALCLVPLQPAQKAYADIDPASGLTYSVYAGAYGSGAYVTASSTTTPVVPDTLGGVPVVSVDLQSSGLASIDVTADTALVSLSCGGNPLTSLDISHNTALTVLSCYNSSIGNVDSDLVPWLAGLGHSGTITPQYITPATVSVSPSAYASTGSTITPMLSVVLGGTTLTQGTQYTVSYRDAQGRFTTPVLPGTYTATINGTGSFTGTATQKATFTVTTDIATATVSPLPDAIYTGSAITPEPTVTVGAVPQSVGTASHTTTLVAGTDYDLTYSSNVSAGTATVHIAGKGLYTGSKDVTFQIAPVDIATASVAPIADQTFSGSLPTPKPTVTWNGATLTESTDYTLSYSDEVSSATVTITGIGNFTGQASATYKLVSSNSSALPSTGDVIGWVLYGLGVLFVVAVVLLVVWAVRRRKPRG